MGSFSLILAAKSSIATYLREGLETKYAVQPQVRKIPVIEVYTRDGCVKCAETKSILSNKNIEFTEKRIGVDIDRDTVVSKFPDAKSLPILVIDEMVIPLNQLI